MHAQWDIAWLIWLIAFIVLAVICWAVFIVAGIVALRTRDDTSMAAPTAVIALVLALIVGGIGTFIAFPFSGQYHRFIPKTGQVAKVGSRFLASDTQGGGTTQKYVVTFRNGQSYGCLDTRCANVAIGDTLTLMCERSFQLNAPNPGWDCNWGQDRKPNGQLVP